jgi:hypothetical protein
VVPHLPRSEGAGKLARMKMLRLALLLPDVPNGAPPNDFDGAVVFEWGATHPPALGLGEAYNGKINGLRARDVVRWAPLPDVPDLRRDLAREKSRADNAERALATTRQLLRVTDQDDLEKLDVITAVWLQMASRSGIEAAEGEGLVAYCTRVLQVLDEKATARAQTYYDAAASAAGMIEALILAIQQAGLDITGNQQLLNERLTALLEVLKTRPGART